MGNFNHFPQLRDALRAASGRFVKKAAFDIQAEAATRAPVATGFLKNSIYVVTSDSSTYGAQGTAAAMLPEVPAPDTDTEAIIAIGAPYGIYVEYGTVRMAAQPYLVPAAEAVRPSFEAAMRRLEAAMASAGGSDA